MLSAVITPTPDIVTQTVLAGPMVGLYLLGVLVAWVFGEAREPAADRQRASVKPSVAPTTAFSRRAWPAFSSTT